MEEKSISSWFVTYLATVLSGLGITVKDHYSRLFARRSQKGRIEFINEVKETIQLLKNIRVYVHGSFLMKDGDNLLHNESRIW